MPPKAALRQAKQHSDFHVRQAATVDQHYHEDDELAENVHGGYGGGNYNNVINTSTNSIGKNQRAS